MSPPYCIIMQLLTSCLSSQTLGSVFQMLEFRMQQVYSALPVPTGPLLILEDVLYLLHLVNPSKELSEKWMEDEWGPVLLGCALRVAPKQEIIVEAQKFFKNHELSKCNSGRLASTNTFAWCRKPEDFGFTCIHNITSQKQQC
ncbi:hypothetical protein B0H13DRAFT_1911450 [Mycena leptocephala]|nr:hypothetical protein B0H13DRAFT_1911450 [Mycena leptocephala]